jgi:NAD(P)-dependent dehydrogenase (short-subunit alcohol dehydrogenase family)
MSARLAGKVALVTGAAGGQGRAVVRRFAAEGARVLALDLTLPDESRAALLADGAADCVEASVADRASIEPVRAALAGLGGCHVLYNNAGLFLPGHGDGPAGEVDLDIWDRVLAVNLTGPYLMTDAVLPLMIGQRTGVIINISSLAGVVGSTSAAYTASKAGLIGLTKSVAVTHGPLGIRSVCLSLGVIETEMSRFTKDSGRWEDVVASVPLGRAAQADEIAGWAAFLASDEAAYANGSNIIIDGGRGVGL